MILSSNSFVFLIMESDNYSSRFHQNIGNRCFFGDFISVMVGTPKLGGVLLSRPLLEGVGVHIIDSI